MRNCFFVSFLFLLALPAIGGDFERAEMLSSFKANAPKFHNITLGADKKVDDLYLADILEVVCKYEVQMRSVETSADISIYKNLHLTLRGSESYNSRLLKDVVSRILLDRAILHALNRDLAVAKEISSFLKNQFNSQSALQYLLDSFREKRDNQELLLTDLNHFDLVLSGDLGKVTSGSLLQDKDEDILCKRMLYCKFIAEYYLEGIVTFIEKGGDFEKLNIGDNRYFKSVMKGEKISFRLFGMKSFRNSNLIAFLRIMNNNEEWVQVNHWLKV